MQLVVRVQEYHQVFQVEERLVVRRQEPSQKAPKSQAVAVALANQDQLAVALNRRAGLMVARQVRVLGSRLVVQQQVRHRPK